MLQYESFAYLDLQKTGSTHLQYLFRQYVDEKPVFFDKHAPVKKRYQRDCLYVLSVRSPVDQYLSLYRYGLDGKGSFYNHLKRKGMGRLYEPNVDSFVSWLEFVLSKDAAPMLKEGYANFDNLHGFLGFFSYRLLRLSLLSFKNQMREVYSKEELVEKVREKLIVHFLIRNESLEDDFLKFIEIASSSVRRNPIRLKKSLNEMRSEVYSKPSVNKSFSHFDGMDGIASNKDVIRIIEEKEWVYQLFGY